MKELLKKLELFYFALNIPLRIYDSNNSRLFSYMLETQEMPGFLCPGKYERELLNISTNTKFVTNDLNEHYYSFEFKNDDMDYKIIAGPTVDYVFNREYILKIVNARNLKILCLDPLNTYFKSIPKYTSEGLRRTEPLLKHLLSGVEVNLAYNLERSGRNDEVEKGSTNISETQRYHHSINKDEMVFEAVKHGDRNRLLTLLYTPADGPDGILCIDDPIRSYKNMFIVTVSHTTKAAIEGGVDSESAYTLSDTFIQRVEQINIYEEITELFISMFNSFLDLVQKTNISRYTSPVYKTIECINKHYQSSITVRELAKRVHLTEGHLFKLFKEQTGMSIKSYVIKKRIDEVRRLLKYTDYDISTICEMTGFNDQSYMTNQFRKETGTTPKRYRNENLL